jgi:hypothetical protein
MSKAQQNAPNAFVAVKVANGSVLVFRFRDQALSASTIQEIRPARRPRIGEGC